MVIQCSECQTRFKLADDKLKPGGIKVRCAKCKHVFSVEPAPVATAATAATETSFAGLQDEEPSQEFSLGQRPDEETAAADRDADAFGLGEGVEKPVWDDFSFADLNQSSPGTDPAADLAEPPSEDFGFGSVPASYSEEELPASREDEFDGGTGSLSDSDDFGFDDRPAPAATDELDFGIEFNTTTDGKDDESAGFDFDSTGAPAAADDFSFGDDGSSGLPEERAEEDAGDDFDFADPPKASTANDVFDFGAEDAAMEFADLDGSPAKTSSWGDLDSDPFGDEFELQGKADQGKAFDFSEMSFQEEPLDDHLGDEDFGSISVEKDSPPEPAKPTLAVAAPSSSVEAGDRSARPAPPVPAAASAQRGPLNRLVIFVLGLFLTLVGAAGYFLWQSGGIVPLMERINGTAPAPMVQPQVRLTGLNGYFVNNKDAGQLFVIQGQATNEFPEIRSAITVKGALYDKNGKLLVQQTVFCGNRLDDTALQELPFASISEAMNNQFGDSLTNLNVAPGKTLPFTIVFRNFPPELAEFTVESVDSRPGSN